jgi:DNA invertase Pin-like site-specific DNA recombinase
MRTREGMAIARSRGKLKGKQPKLTARQQAELVRMRASGEYTIADLMEMFSVGRATVYRVLERAGHDPGASGCDRGIRRARRHPGWRVPEPGVHDRARVTG